MSLKVDFYNYIIIEITIISILILLTVLLLLLG